MPPHPALSRQDSTAPQSAATPAEHVSHTPKIGGSETAFIVLVIVLATIVIASSAGIYFLLRYGEPSAADRAARRKYSIRRRGVRTHPLPIGLPGSLGEKIGSVFKGRRAGTGTGWVPARDDDDDDGMNEWDATVEPLREREPEPGHQHQQRDEFPRVGSAPASRRATLMEAATHRSREVSHVDGRAEHDPNASQVTAPSVPDEEWVDADDTRSGTVVGGGGAIPQGYYFTSQPRRADSGHEIQLFAGSTPFRDDTYDT